MDDIASKLITVNLKNFVGQLFEKILKLLDCFVGNVFLEFYQHNMIQHDFSFLL
jgi:hypothetical protein